MLYLVWLFTVLCVAGSRGVRGGILALPRSRGAGQQSGKVDPPAEE